MHFLFYYSKPSDVFRFLYFRGEEWTHRPFHQSQTPQNDTRLLNFHLFVLEVWTCLCTENIFFYFKYLFRRPLDTAATLLDLPSYATEHNACLLKDI
jgi:hypothetical protein